MKILATIEDYIKFYDDEGFGSETVGLVPTLGALHAGHLSLVMEAKKTCAKVVVSIFVNPLQFGPDEDFDAYPRTLEDDCALLRTVGVDAVFAPERSEMYGKRHQTIIANEEMASILCGAHRPGHFAGVLTVVMKLFQIIQPTHGFFGEKDRQQLTMITKMVSDLHLPWQIVGCPTVREPSGLALSSRNRYLSPEALVTASRIYEGLCQVKSALECSAGEVTTAELKDQFRSHITAGGQMTVEYFEILDASDLVPLTEKPQPGQNFALFTACFLTGVRLIDNITGTTGPHAPTQ